MTQREPSRADIDLALMRLLDEAECKRSRSHACRRDQAAHHSRKTALRCPSSTSMKYERYRATLVPMSVNGAGLD
jgi:hypothetical protein